jgi:hypothetical protein
LGLNVTLAKQRNIVNVDMFFLCNGEITRKTVFEIIEIGSSF